MGLTQQITDWIEDDLGLDRGTIHEIRERPVAVAEVVRDSVPPTARIVSAAIVVHGLDADGNVLCQVQCSVADIAAEIDAQPEPERPLTYQIVADGPDTLWYTRGDVMTQIGAGAWAENLDGRDRAVLRALCEHVQRELQEPF